MYMNLHFHVRIVGDKKELHINHGALLRVQELSPADSKLIREVKECLSFLTKDVQELADKRGYRALLHIAPLPVSPDHPLILEQESHCGSSKKQSKKH